VDRLKLIIKENKANFPELAAHPNFEKRLKWELIEIEVQDEENYFLDLFEKKVLRPNPHNLLVPVLLGVCEAVDLNTEPAYKMGDFPDVDVDYLPPVRDYLKNVWAPQAFGAENVCSIGNYGTFGLKSSLIDMTRVHGYDRNEILQITTAMGLKDDDGQALTLDKALEMYPELRTFCDNHPDVVRAVRKLLHRNRSMGKHAGGLIICNSRIDNFVPLVRGTDGNPVSAWVEGLHGQDLGPVGLIKFDLLVVDGLYQIALATRYVKTRHNIESMCALPGDWDWSDTAYLNDPDSMQMANAGDLKCIFQYDSDGIRTLAMKGGVDSFDDLVAYVSIYRPSTLQMHMDEEYVERKHGRRPYEVPKILEPYLGKTYGVMVYQEQVMQILHVVGRIPLRDCYQVIKAISKKKVDGFKKYKEKFIENGQETLGKTQKEMEEYWNLVEAFSGYGFNASHATAYSYISARQLYLKSHYPLEFFVASLQCQDGDEKRRDYITEASNHGVDVKPLTINKSRETFDIVDESIYVGYGNIKGIGDDKAKRIVELQPYSNFEDFLERYGTEAGTVKPLIGLRIFGDDIEKQYAFYLKFVEFKKQLKDKEKRYQKNVQGFIQSVIEVVPNGMKGTLAKVAEPTVALLDLVVEHVEKKNPPDKVEIIKKVREIQKKFSASEGRYMTSLGKLSRPNYDSVTFDDCKEVDKEFLKLIKDQEKSEITFYGYVWTNKVRLSPKFKQGFSFEIAKRKHLVRPQPFYIIYGIVSDVTIKTFKSGNGKFASLELIDEDIRSNRITIWEDDYLIFKEDLMEGNFISIQVSISTGKYQGFTMYGPPRHKRHTLPNKKYDTRLVVLEGKNDVGAVGNS
jgi:DNA polymerase III alpha subunit